MFHSQFAGIRFLKNLETLITQTHDEKIEIMFCSFYNCCCPLFYVAQIVKTTNTKTENNKVTRGRTFSHAGYELVPS